ncbi:MAG: hypothetical protein ACLQDM_15275 [Bradyrhizobium sp.]
MNAKFVVGICWQMARGVLITAAGSAGLASPAWALECPMPQKLAQPGVLEETQAQIEAVGKRLSGGDLNSEVQAIIAELRGRYPSVENAEIVNYIVTAYCPIVAGLEGLSEAEKKERLEVFVRQLMARIY